MLRARFLHLITFHVPTSPGIETATSGMLSGRANHYTTAPLTETIRTTHAERQVTIATIELESYGKDIAALSETIFSIEGQLTDDKEDESEPIMHCSGFEVSM